MAKISRWLPLTALAGLAIGGGLWLGLAGPREARSAARHRRCAAAGDTTDAQIAGSLADDIKRAALLQRPEVLDYQARLTFVGDYQIFIKSAAELSEEERRQRAAALARRSTGARRPVSWR